MEARIGPERREGICSKRLANTKMISGISKITDPSPAGKKLVYLRKFYTNNVSMLRYQDVYLTILNSSYFIPLKFAECNERIVNLQIFLRYPSSLLVKPNLINTFAKRLNQFFFRLVTTELNQISWRIAISLQFV